MRKVKLLWVVVFSMVVVFAYSAAERPEIDVPYMDPSQVAITIDGHSEDWPDYVLEAGINFYNGDGKKGNARVLGTTVLGTMTGREDGEVSVHLAHDGTYLYILTIIQDDLLEQRTSENNKNEAWKEDALHIYIDTNNSAIYNISGTPIVVQPGYEQFGVSTDYSCYTENCDFVTTRSSDGTAGLGSQPDQVHWLVGIQISGSGPYTYVFEERVPMQEVSGHNLRTMIPGESYGFNAEFVDSDAGVFLQGWIFWSGPGSTDVWNSESRWGIMNIAPVEVTFVHHWMMF